MHPLLSASLGSAIDIMIWWDQGGDLYICFRQSLKFRRWGYNINLFFDASYRAQQVKHRLPLTDQALANSVDSLLRMIPRLMGDASDRHSH